MTFAKAAAESLYSADDIDEKEEKAERSKEILQLAIASGLLLGGAGLAYANRDRIRDSLGGIRIFDSRGRTQRDIEDRVGFGPSTAGASLGVGGGLIGPLRRNRYLLGDTYDQQSLPSLGRRVLRPGDQGGQIAGVFGGGNQDATQATARAFAAAAGPRGDRTFTGRMAAGERVLDDPSAPGQRLFDHRSGKISDYLKSWIQPNRGAREAETVFRTIGTVDTAADQARAMLAGGTKLEDLPPRLRNSLDLETQGVREYSGGKVKPKSGSRFFTDAAPSLRLGDVAARTDQSRNVGPRTGLSGLITRGIGGALAGHFTARGADAFRGGD